MANELLKTLDYETLRAVEIAREFIKTSNGLFDDEDIPAFVAGYLVKASANKETNHD